ncbi:DUF4932 domain-containing protein [Croceitalea marina]|uniref:DUF4932 domain-containing protein n=1 Tax=Croceitalea marina TaxID=1775166 RepID=A0ABW5MQL3_9FLAO
MKLFKKFLKYVIVPLLALLLLIVIVYFIKPKLVEDTAIALLYPTVTIEEQYQNKYTIEVPAMNELMYIACSLTQTFQEDENLISTTTPEYLNDVSAHFAPLKNHALVQLLESQLKGNAYSQIQPTIRFFSLNYQITPENTIQEQEVFHVNGLLLQLFKSKVFYYPDHLELIEDFAKKSDFYSFYTEHQPYYENLINRFDQLCDIQESWDFLEAHFPERYNSYRIIFSPLTGGFHNTLPGLKDPRNEKYQAWLFVSPPPRIALDSLSEDELEIAKSKFTRQLFTEMDHNYVNLATDKFLKLLDETIPDYKKWNTRKRGYSSNYSTFNEYMTWGVFGLYARNAYSKKNIDTILFIHENMMVASREFVHFPDFQEQLHSLSKDHNDYTNMYPALLKWMDTYNN